MKVVTLVHLLLLLWAQRRVYELKSFYSFPNMLMVTIKDTNGSIAGPVFSLWCLQAGRETLIMQTLEKLGRSERAYETELMTVYAGTLGPHAKQWMNYVCVGLWLFPACWAQLGIPMEAQRKASGITGNTHDQGITFVSACGFCPVLAAFFCHTAVAVCKLPNWTGHRHKYQTLIRH